MGCKPLAHSGHRNIKISGDGLVALRLFVFFHNLFSQIQTTLYTSFFSPCSVWHTKQRLSQLFSILTGCKCDNYIAHTSYLPQVCLNTNYKSITCLKSNYFLQFWQGAKNVEFCVKLDQVWLFFCLFCVVAVQTKTINVKTKTFAIEKILREVFCFQVFIFWQNCKGANIFGHDCMGLIYIATYCNQFDVF